MVAPVHPAPAEVEKQLSALRKPQFLVVRRKLHRHVLDGGVFRLQPDLRDGCDHVGFQAAHLEVSPRNPPPPAERDWKRLAAYAIRPQACELVRPLPKMHLPRQSAVPTA